MSVEHRVSAVINSGLQQLPWRIPDLAAACVADVSADQASTVAADSSTRERRCQLGVSGVTSRFIRTGLGSSRGQGGDHCPGQNLHRASMAM